MNNNTQGYFVSFEGGEGAGKSTQVELLSLRLKNIGCKVLSTREPGGSIGAEKIRSLLVSGHVERWDPLTEALLHNAARLDHLNSTILPALKDGNWVVCDRFCDSTLAYQGYGQGVDKNTLALIQKCVVTKDPDITFVLDIPVDQGFKRLKERFEKLSRYEKMNLEIHERLRHGFLSIAKENSNRCKVIDASLEPEDIHEQIWNIMCDRFSNIITQKV